MEPQNSWFIQKNGSICVEWSPWHPKIIGQIDQNENNCKLQAYKLSIESCLVSDVSLDAGSAVERAVRVDAERVGDAAAVADGALVDVVAPLTLPVFRKCVAVP